MSEAFQSSKFKYLSDPPVVTRPFSVEIDEDKCIGCGVCIKQCPCQTVEMVGRDAPSERQQPACQFACPAGVDVRGYLKVLGDGGSLAEAWKILSENNPFSAITGRVCPHPCETSCNRYYIDDAVSINALECFIGDFAVQNTLVFDKIKSTRKEKVAIVGSGPSGMACAYFLARRGYRVTVFESRDKPGGMLTHAIPGYRLPNVVVQKEFQRVIDLGVEVRYNTRVGKDISLDEIRKTYQAVYIAVGAQDSPALGIEGEDAGNVLPGLDFLRMLAEGKTVSLGKKVIVVGGGNTAIDSARSARRSGSDVTVIYRRSENEMPAYDSEIEEARNEGVKIEFLAAPAKINSDDSNTARTVTCIRMKLGKEDASGRPKPIPVKGSEFTLEMDSLIAAIGQEADMTGFDSLEEKSGWIQADNNGMTSQKGVFAGGDIAAGPGTVSEAIGMGGRAARAIEAFIQGKTLPLDDKMEIDYRDIPLYDHQKIPRNVAPALDITTRLKEPDAQVNLSLSLEQVNEEKNRCIQCGMYKPKFTGIQYFGKICIACHNCEAICPNEALSFPHFYQINEGRWAHDCDYPTDGNNGYPNPLMRGKVPAFDSIKAQLTGVEQVVYTRRSTRVYKSDPVPKELINRVLEAGRFAPSAGNCQGWKFVVLTDKTLMDELSESTLKFLNLFTKLYQGKDPFRSTIKKSLAFLKPEGIDQRPMVAMQALLTPKFGDKKLSAFFDAPVAILLLPHHQHISDASLGIGICAQNMVLAAHSLGLGTCYVGFIATSLNMDPKTKKKFGARLGIEWPYDSVGTVLTMGYPAIKVDKPVERETPRIQWVE